MSLMDDLAGGIYHYAVWNLTAVGFYGRLMNESLQGIMIFPVRTNKGLGIFTIFDVAFNNASLNAPSEYPA